MLRADHPLAGRARRDFTRHQATQYCLTTKTAEAAYAHRMVGGSIAIVLLQCMAVCSVFRANFYKPCEHNDQCETKGMFCGVGGRVQANGYDGGSACWYCGTCGGGGGGPHPCPLWAVRDDVTGESWNSPEDALMGYKYMGFNATAAIELCASPEMARRPPCDEWDDWRCNEV